MQPVLDVVAVKEWRVGAPGKDAAAVAQHQGPADGGRNTAGAAADVQRLPIAVLAHGHKPAITGHPPQRFRGNAGAILQGGRPLAIGSQRLLPLPTVGRGIRVEGRRAGALRSQAFLTGWRTMVFVFAGAVRPGSEM